MRVRITLLLTGKSSPILLLGSGPPIRWNRTFGACNVRGELQTAAGAESELTPGRCSAAQPEAEPPFGAPNVTELFLQPKMSLERAAGADVELPAPSTAAWIPWELLGTSTSHQHTDLGWCLLLGMRPLRAVPQAPCFHESLL